MVVSQIEGDRPIDIPENTGDPYVADFSKELADFLSDDKLTNRGEISNFLQKNLDLKSGFENFLKTANTLLKKKCVMKLQERHTDDEIKSIILEFIPEGYNIGNNSGIEFDNSILEQRYQEVVQKEEEAVQKEEEEVQKEEEAVQKEEEAVQNEEEAVQKEEEAVQKEEEMVQIGEEADKQKYRNDALKERKKLLVGHENLDEKTKEKAELAQQQIPEETINQLKEKGYDDNFINDYILLRVTLAEVRGNPDFDKNQVAQFESSVNKLSNLDVLLKNLDNACNIPDTSLNSFSTKNISQTRTELFYDESEGVGNKSLRNFRDSRLKSREYPEGFFDMDEDMIISKYRKFLSSKDKWLLEAYDRQVEQNSLEGYRDSADYVALLEAVTGIKEAMDVSTKKMVEEFCIISQIKGMYMCMGEGVNFDLNKAKDIKLGKDGSMILDGHIDGVDFSIRQDARTSRLQSSQKIFRNPDNALSIGNIEKNNFVDSNFILPNQNNIFGFITDIIKKDSSLESCDNQEDYIQNLQKNIMLNIDKKYSDAKYSNFYMKEQVKSEKISQDVMEIIQDIGGLGKNNLTGMDGPLYDFFDTLHFNLENMTYDEKEKFGKCIEKLGDLIHEGGNEALSDNLSKNSEIAKFLGSKDRTLSVLQGKNLQDDGLSFFNFFSFFYKKSDEQRIGPGGEKMLNLDELDNFVNGNIGGCPIALGRLDDRNKESEAEAFLENELKKLTYFK